MHGRSRVRDCVRVLAAAPLYTGVSGYAQAGAGAGAAVAVAVAGGK